MITLLSLIIYEGKFMNKDLQKSRNRQYFIDTAKDLLLKEGFSQLTIRNIGEAAGFSYATIYNYFQDLNHLLWHVAMSFIGEIVRSFEKELANKPYSLQDLKTIYRAYAGYFLKNPNVFYLIFFHLLGG